MQFFKVIITIVIPLKIYDIHLVFHQNNCNLNDLPRLLGPRSMGGIIYCFPFHKIQFKIQIQNEIVSETESQTEFI